MTRNRGTRWQLRLMLAALLIGTSTADANDIMKVEHILANPSAMHRRPVVLQGTVNHVTQITGKGAYNVATCGQGFVLEDGTGSINVVYLIRCTGEDENVMAVGDGDQVLVHATVDAPPTNVVTKDGTYIGFRVMASRLTKIK